MSDTYDTDDFDSDESENSPVIKKLRAELRAKEKAIAEANAKLEQVEAAAQTKRAEAATNEVNRLGLPGLKDDVLGWIEGEVTPEKVIDALKARSIPVPEDIEASVEGQRSDQRGERSDSASNVGQRVADAAGGQDQRDLETRIAQATSAKEIAELMAEAGLARSHSN